MLSKGYRKKSVSPQQILFFILFLTTMLDEREWWESEKFAAKGGKEKKRSVASDMDGERHFKGKFIFLRWHTHRLVTKTQNHSPYLLIGGFLFSSFFFDFSGLWCEQNKRKPLKCGRHSPINLWKQAKMFRSCAGGRTLALIERRRCGRPGRQPYTSLLCINTAKDIFHLEIWISSPNSRERRCPLSLALPLTHHNAS